MTTLFEILVNIARDLDQAHEASATGGSATTLLDSLNWEPDDYWNGGTIFFISGGRAGSSATPLDWDAAAKSLSVPSGAVIDSGDRYLLLHPKWGRDDLVRFVNVALAELWITNRDESLVANGSREYDLPAGCARLIGVEIGGETDGWIPHYQWSVTHEHLHFYGNAPAEGAGHIRLAYRARPASLAADTDAVSEQVDQKLVTLLAAAYLHRWRFALVRGQEPHEQKLAEQYMELANQRKLAQGTPTGAPHFGTW